MSETEGLSESEIIALEQEYDVKFPLVYRQFLALLGKKDGGLFHGYCMTYPAVRRNGEGALQLLKLPDGSLHPVSQELKPGYFFFAQWQGYNYWFFDCDAPEDDPLIYVLTDDNRIDPLDQTLSESITNFVG
ncbi:SMI1/KNR4 family protein [Chitinophaga dinghuensis]|nr:SMI1/KNR4 family protein [Chitinophaga dinghuensis]